MTYNNCQHRKHNPNNIILANSPEYGCPIVKHPDWEDEYYCLKCGDKLHKNGLNDFVRFSIVMLIVGLLGILFSSGSGERRTVEVNNQQQQNNQLKFMDY